MAKLFQRLNPHIDTGQRSPQTLGEELLDYRNYLELSIEVNRGTDGWLQAESGALSTGEAIGTGQAILLMVVQSWEESLVAYVVRILFLVDYCSWMRLRDWMVSLLRPCLNCVSVLICSY